MHQAMPCLITGLGCAAVPTFGITVLVGKKGDIEKENKRLEGELKESKEKAEKLESQTNYPSDDYIADLIDTDINTFKTN